MQYALADVSGRGIDEIRPLAPALGALLPLLPLPVPKLSSVYRPRLHISPPQWAGANHTPIPAAECDL